MKNRRINLNVFVLIRKQRIYLFIFFSIHIKNYTTCYIYVLLYFLITRQQYNTTGTGPQGARDDGYPVAINIKTYR